MIFFRDIISVNIIISNKKKNLPKKRRFLKENYKLVYLFWKRNGFAELKRSIISGPPLSVLTFDNLDVFMS